MSVTKFPKLYYYCYYYYHYKTHLNFILRIDTNKSLGSRFRSELSQARTETQRTFVDLSSIDIFLV